MVLDAGHSFASVSEENYFVVVFPLISSSDQAPQRESLFSDLTMGLAYENGLSGT